MKTKKSRRTLYVNHDISHVCDYPVVCGVDGCHFQMDKEPSTHKVAKDCDRGNLWIMCGIVNALRHKLQPNDVECPRPWSIVSGVVL